MPTLTIFVGTNGAGKSTIYNLIKKRKKLGKRINPDEILQKNNGDWQNTNDIAKSGMIAIKQIRECISKKMSFNWEMTLISNYVIKQLKDAISQGYKINLVFVGVSDLDVCINRIEKRMQNGGHGVPESLVSNRFNHQFDNLSTILPFLHSALFFDNTRSPQIVAKFKKNTLKLLDPNCKWLTNLITINNTQINVTK